MLSNYWNETLSWLTVIGKLKKKNLTVSSEVIGTALDFNQETRRPSPQKVSKQAVRAKDKAVFFGTRESWVPTFFKVVVPHTYVCRPSIYTNVACHSVFAAFLFYLTSLDIIACMHMKDFLIPIYGWIVSTVGMDYNLLNQSLMNGHLNCF